MIEDNQMKVVQDLIVNTYENMGLVVLDIKPHAQGVFKLDIMNAIGLHEAYVTVLLQMNNVN